MQFIWLNIVRYMFHCMFCLSRFRLRLSVCRRAIWLLWYAIVFNLVCALYIRYLYYLYLCTALIHSFCLCVNCSWVTVSDNDFFLFNCVYAPCVRACTLSWLTVRSFRDNGLLSLFSKLVSCILLSARCTLALDTGIELSQWHLSVTVPSLSLFS